MKTTDQTLIKLNSRAIYAIFVMACSIPIACWGDIPPTSESQQAEAEKGISVTSSEDDTPVESTKVYSSEELSRFQYDDGASPRPIDRPHFASSVKDSVFLAVRVKLFVGMEPVKIGGIRISETPKDSYQPIAFTTASADDFSFIAPNVWYDAKRWRTIEFMQKGVAPAANKLLLMKTDKEGPLRLDVIYEVPNKSREFSLIYQKEG